MRKSKPFGKKVCYIAKRFNYAKLYQLSGHYTIAGSGQEPSKSENTK